LNNVQALRQAYWASLQTQQQQQKEPSVWYSKSTHDNPPFYDRPDDRQQQNGAVQLLWQAFEQQKQPCCTAQPTGLATLQRAAPGMFQHLPGRAAVCEPMQTATITPAGQPTGFSDARQPQRRLEPPLAASNSTSPVRSSCSDSGSCNRSTPSSDSSGYGPNDDVSCTTAADGTLSNTQQAYALVERAAPAYSFSKSSRWVSSQHQQHDDQNSESDNRCNTSVFIGDSKLLQAAEAAAAADAYATARRLLGLVPGESSSDVDPAAVEAYAAARHVLGLPPDVVLADQQQHKAQLQQKQKSAKNVQSPWAFSARAEAAAAAAKHKHLSDLQSPAVCQDAVYQLDASPSPTRQRRQQQQQQHGTADATSRADCSVGRTVRVSARPDTHQQEQQQDAQLKFSQVESMHSHTSTQQLQHDQAAGAGAGAGTGAAVPGAAANGMDLLKPK
jgi:hypothetical protein